MSSRSIRGAATITSPAIMSAMRITPSSMMRDSGAMTSRCSASARVSISSARESGPGDRNSTTRSNRLRFSLPARGSSRIGRLCCGSDTSGVESGRRRENTRSGGGQPALKSAWAAVRCPRSNSESSMSQGLIPATILTGFLGSGKTTLLKRVLTESHGQKIAVIENEFGEESIDNEILVADTGEQIIQMNNGCVCCTIREDLRSTLSTLAEKKRKGELDFERVVIETTGLADPGPVAQTFFMDDEIAESYLLDSVLTLVDAKHAEGQLDSRLEARRQIGFADQIFISKTDLVDAGEVDALAHRLKHMNPRAPQSRVHFGEVPLAKVFDLRGFNLNAKLEIDPEFLNADGHEHDHDHHDHDHDDDCDHPHHHHHDDDVKSFVF